MIGSRLNLSWGPLDGRCVSSDQKLKKGDDMVVRELKRSSLGMDEDWVGNNAAFRCPVPGCGKVFIVNATKIHHGDPKSGKPGERKCPNCGKSIARIVGGKKSGGKASIERPD